MKNLFPNGDVNSVVWRCVVVSVLLSFGIWQYTSRQHMQISWLTYLATWLFAQLLFAKQMSKARDWEVPVSPPSFALEELPIWLCLPFLAVIEWLLCLRAAYIALSQEDF